MKNPFGYAFSVAIPVAAFAATLAVVLVGLAGPVHAQRQQSAVPTEPISVSDVITRINSYARMSPENAELVLGSVDASNDPVVRLELALLLVYGPQPARDRVRGLRVLEGLVRDNDSKLIPEQTVGMIEVLMRHLREVIALESDLDRAMMRLEQETRARQAADEKLDALRQIEQELEAIKEENSGGEDDGQNRQG